MKKIEGQVRKIRTKSGAQEFFDFEFWAESDEDTYGLLCLVQVSNPYNLFVTEMDANELTNTNDAQDLKIVIERISRETGVMDLVFPKVLRFDEKKNDVKAGFQAFLKSYVKPVSVYESIFDHSEEAVQVEKLSIEQFNRLGGKVTLIGNLSLKA